MALGIVQTNKNKRISAKIGVEWSSGEGALARERASARGEGKGGEGGGGVYPRVLTFQTLLDFCCVSRYFGAYAAAVRFYHRLEVFVILRLYAHSTNATLP